MFYNVPSSSHSFLGCNCFVAARNWSKTHPAPLIWRSAAQLEAKRKLPHERPEHDDLCRWCEFYAREA